MMVKPDSGYQQGTFASWGSPGSTHQSLGFRLMNSQTRTWWWGDDHDAGFGGSDLYDGAFHHVMATFDGSTRRTFIDGVMTGSMAGSRPSGKLTSIGTFCIGQTAGFAGIFDYSGEMSHVRIWAIARSIAQPAYRLYSHTALPGWDGKWDSAQSFCQSEGGDLCDYATMCYHGRTHDSVFGQLSEDEWVPVKGVSVHKEYVQIGTRTSPNDDCCLVSDTACHGLSGRTDWADAWGSRQNYQDHIPCCFG